MCALVLSGVAIAFGAGTGSSSNSYLQHNLVADTPGVADVTDPHLVNAWGISEGPTSPFWISDNGTGLTTVYNTSGAILPLVVTIAPPTGQSGTAAPSGQVFNNTQSFLLANGKPAVFIFVTEDGTISAWNSGTATELKADNSASGAIYKGLALGANTTGPKLYLANFNAGTIEVFDGNFASTKTEGRFTDPSLPPGYAPFNIAALNGRLYVSYAVQDDMKHDDVAGAGNGLVDVFDMDGNFLRRLISNGPLNSPWGMVMAPAEFGAFSNALLVGNFGDGAINAFDPSSGAMLGSLQDIQGKPIAIEGLWGLVFGNGGLGGVKNTLYFTAGPGDEQHGLFGSLTATPPVSNDVINSASNLAGPIAPGEAITLLGTDLGPTTLVPASIPASGVLASSPLAGTSVTVNGSAAPILYVSAKQTAILVPFALAGSTSADIVVTFGGGTPVTFSVPVAPTSPGIFTMDSSGGGQAVAFNQNGSLNSKTNAAHPGDVITLYATGAGQTEPKGTDGLVEGDVFRTTVAETSATIGGKPAQVIYSGSTPGQLSGIVQVEAVIPTGATGAVPVVLTIGQQSSQTNATIFVQLSQ